MELITENKENGTEINLSLRKESDGSVVLFGGGWAIMKFKNGKFCRYNCQELAWIDAGEAGGIKEAEDEANCLIEHPIEKLRKAKAFTKEEEEDLQKYLIN